MKIYERYLAREIYSATALVLVAFLMLFAFFDLIGEIQNLGRGGYQLYHAAAYVALTLPGRAYDLFPIAVLIGTLYALTQLGRHSEITVLRASGLSTAGFLRSLVKLGVVFVVLTLLIGEYVAPPAERAAQQLRLRAMSSMVAQGDLRSGLWVKDEEAFLNVRDVDQEERMKDVRLYEFDNQYRLHAITQAGGGEYEGPGRWRLNDVVRTLFEGDHARVERLPTLEWKSSLTPELLSVMLVVPEKMPIFSLYLYVRHLVENHQKTDRYEIAIWKKLAYPFSSLVMMVLALPFGYMQTQFGNASVKVFIGIMLGIGFHLLNGLFSSLGMINSWMPFWSAITPSALFLAGASSLLWWVERR